MTIPSRRSLIRAGLVLGAGAAAAPGLLAPASAAPASIRSGRATLTHGVQSGDVTTTSAVVWGRASRPGRLLVELDVPGRGGRRVVRGPVVEAATDLTGAVRLPGLKPGETYEYRVLVETEDGPGEPVAGRFSTAPVHGRDVSFVWTGDTAGQGWGVNAETGMTGYRAMSDVAPDFFVHSGDTVYADGPIAATVTLRDGSTWRNVVSDGVGKVAETLDEFRGRYRYNLQDVHVQAMNAVVPVYAQWDDHETTNNWYPGEVLEDARYTQERRVDVLAARARQAFTEYFPFDARRRDAEGKVYGRFSRGPHLDLFTVDMRSYRAANSANLQESPGPETRFLGAEQLEWLVGEMSRSRATWKAVLSDMPLGLVVPDGSLAQEGIANRDGGAPRGRELEIATLLSRLKAAGVRNVVWFTADVHYCAAHHYDPSRAAFTDFEPFWEFVGGPINAGTFGPNQLDGTFGPRVDFLKAADYPNQPPSDGNQFFGHARVDGRSGQLTVSLRDIAGNVLYTRELQPA